jgi:NAD(P)-dependent dehydrogenase (short-subunit alcohol dehydrogenase family)
MKIYIVTGAARGLGLSIAQNLSKKPDNQVVLAVRDLEAGRIQAREMGPRVSARQIDMSSSESVDRFINDWSAPLAGIVNNAGIQIVDATRTVEPEGWEMTFAVNHLNALRLTMGLLPHLQQARVLFIGSGTHNPKNLTAGIFGFRGALFESIRKCADGLGTSSDPKQLGLDRYATSKFLNAVTTVELARRIHESRTAFYCLDPGLMAGTGLARTAPPAIRFAWNHVLPIVAKALPDTSTPSRSGAAAAWLMTAQSDCLKNGGVYSYDKKLSTRCWEKVFDPDIGSRVLEESLELIGAQSDQLRRN